MGLSSASERWIPWSWSTARSSLSPYRAYGRGLHATFSYAASRDACCHGAQTGRGDGASVVDAES